MVRSLKGRGATIVNAYGTCEKRAGKFMASLKTGIRSLMERGVHFRLVSRIKSSNLLQVRFISPKSRKTNYTSFSSLKKFLVH